jgi:hypothetical protein
MTDPPVIDVITRQDGSVAWRICASGICVVAGSISEGQARLSALCRSRGIEPPRWPRG